MFTFASQPVPGSVSQSAKPGVQLVLAAKGVPAGDYAREALGKAGIGKPTEQNVVSNEADDASVVQKIASDEADAAIVYSSDVAGASGTGVEAISIPASINVIATYPIGILSSTHNIPDSGAFMRFVTGARGQAILHSFGFLPPPPS